MTPPDHKLPVDQRLLQQSFRRLLDNLEDLSIPAESRTKIQAEIHRISFLTGYFPVEHQETFNLLDQIDWVLQTCEPAMPAVICHFDPSSDLVTVADPWPLRKLMFDALSKERRTTLLTISLSLESTSNALITITTEDERQLVRLTIPDTTSKPRSPVFASLTALVISNDRHHRTHLANRLNHLGIKCVDRFDYGQVDFCIATDERNPALLALESQLQGTPILYTANHQEGQYVVNRNATIRQPLTQTNIASAINGVVLHISQPTTSRILIVDDNLSNTRLLQTQLQELGHAVDVAVSGNQAIDAIQKTSYTMVFMDLQMPDLNGIETTKLIRQSNVQTPIYGLTAHVSATERRACIAAGMEDLLTKPIRMERLQGITRLISGETNRPKRRSRHQNLPVFDQNLALENADNRIDMAREMLSLLIESLPIDLANMNQASEDPALLRRHTHALHGALRYCGTPRLQNAVQKLEQATINEDIVEISALLHRVNSEAETLIAWYRDQGELFHTPPKEKELPR